MRDNRVNVLKKMLGMLLVAPVMLSLSLYATDPIHLWELDENDTSQIYVDSVGDANGSCPGVTGERCPTPSVGIINGAQDFNATELDRIDIVNRSNFDWATDANATITFWMKKDMAPVSNRAMIGRTYRDILLTQHILWYIGVDTTGKIRVAVVQDKTVTPAYDVASGDTNVTDGAWHYIAVVLCQTDIKVYVDGVSDFNITRTQPASDLSSGTDVNIGSLNLIGSEIPYNGSLDDIMLYNVDLNASEIKANYDSIVSPPAPEPTPTPTTTTSSGGGGGCTYNPDSKHFDMVFLLMIALGLFYPVRRRFIK